MTEPATPRIVTRDEWERARAELLVREPQDKAGSWWRRDGRLIAQWTRTNAAVK
jgi:hypothetical protein